MKAIEGHLVTGYAEGVDAPDKQLELLSGALEAALAFLDERPETRARMERVCQLVDGFESSFGLELLATVHWIVSTEPVQNTGDVVARTRLEGKASWFLPFNQGYKDGADNPPNQDGLKTDYL